MTFIGPKPENTPKYAAPFEAINGIVYDVDGVEITAPNTSDSEDDALLAQAIADALNEKFGGGGQPIQAEPAFDFDTYRYFREDHTGVVYRVVGGGGYEASAEAFRVGEWRADTATFATLDESGSTHELPRNGER